MLSVEISRKKYFSLPLEKIEQKKIQQRIDAFRPDIVHSHHPFGLGRLALDISNAHDLPLVYTYHTLYEFFAHHLKLDFDKIRKFVREYCVEYTRHCDVVITPTQPIADHLAASGVESPIEVVPTGLDVERFRRVRPEQVEKLRSEYDLQGYDLVLLNVGRITQEKNVERCLETLVELRKRGHHAGLILFGQGPDEGEMKRKARKVDVQDHFILGGFLDQQTLAAAYSLGDVFLFPSLSDTQGIVLYEALAAGLPVVATESLAASAIIEEGENGLLVEDSPTSFADAVEKVVKDPDRYTTPLDLNRYGHEYIGKRCADIYREAIEKGHRPDHRKTDLLTHLLRSVGMEW